MIIHTARHGQPLPDNLPSGSDNEYPPGDYPLSALGRHQAELLGTFLKSEGFHGKIFSSPYLRTMETASIVAEACGLSVFPEPRIQERLFYPEPPCPGLDREDLKKLFANFDPAAELEYPWIIPKGIESMEDVGLRVRSFLDDLLADPSGGDVLLIGHGATVNAIMQDLSDRAGFSGNAGRPWNCAVGSFEANPDGTVRLLRPLYIDFIPLESITSNRIRLVDRV